MVHTKTFFTFSAFLLYYFYLAYADALPYKITPTILGWLILSK